METPCESVKPSRIPPWSVYAFDLLNKPVPPRHGVYMRLVPNFYRTLVCSLLSLGLASMVLQARGEEEQSAPLAGEAAAPLGPAGDAAAVEKVYQQAHPSLAVISVAGRDGKLRGLGSGFVVDDEGLIATNMHVIGEGRAIEVQLADGKRAKVLGIHAYDRFLDLAILRIDARGLKPLRLGDSESLRAGQAVVALGNPQGLRHSVVAGVVSGRREIDDRSMIQLAIPVEQGNSGGPLVDLQGHVHGILTMKSAVTANLGFAMPINDLKPLLAKPNPVPIDRWIQQSVVDSRSWQTLWGAQWRTRGNRIVVEGEGEAFGGRSLCLSTKEMQELPFEVAVSVRLDDEAGAAGLVFGADGGDKHYGFYPSNGGLQLTRFDGPDVLNWKILSQQNSAAYRQGEWNKLHVRVTAQRVVCSVNGHAVISLEMADAPVGRVGLAKFRDTKAEFKGFQLGKELASPHAPADVAARIDKLLTELPADRLPALALTEQLAAAGEVTPSSLTERADRLAQQALQLRRLSEGLTQSRVQADLLKQLNQPEEEIDLLIATLLISCLDNAEIDIESYRELVNRMAADIAGGIPADADEEARLAALNKFFFEESGFHGSRTYYYHRANSYINEVLDDREGLPITLSVVYMELARRLALKVEGVGLPGHFVVRFRPAMGAARLLDVFDRGEVITDEEANERVLAATGSPLTAESRQAMTKRAIALRILNNLVGAAQRAGDESAMLRYLDATLALSPDAAEQRWARALLRWQSGEHEGAKQDADWLIEHQPAGAELERVRDFRAILQRALQ